MSKKNSDRPKSTQSSTWITVLSSGFMVAAVTFSFPKLWDHFQHKPATAETVHIALRVEESDVLVFVRNQSDDTVDFSSAILSINDTRLASTKTYGAFPDISHIYSLRNSAEDSYSVDIMGDNIVFKLGIAQSIDPAGVDQFGFQIESALEELQLEVDAITVELFDIRGKKYVATNQ